MIRHDQGDGPRSAAGTGEREPVFAGGVARRHGERDRLGPIEARASNLDPRGRARVHRHRVDRGRNRSLHRCECITPRRVARVGRIAYLEIVRAGSRCAEREQRVGGVGVIRDGDLPSPGVVDREDRVEVGLQVVDLVLESVAPDFKADPFPLLGREGVPVRHPRACRCGPPRRPAASASGPSRDDRWPGHSPRRRPGRPRPQPGRRSKPPAAWRRGSRAGRAVHPARPRACARTWAFVCRRGRWPAFACGRSAVSTFTTSPCSPGPWQSNAHEPSKFSWPEMTISTDRPRVAAVGSTLVVIGYEVCARQGSGTSAAPPATAMNTTANPTRLMAHSEGCVGKETALTGSPRMARATVSGRTQAALAGSALRATPPVRRLRRPDQSRRARNVSLGTRGEPLALVDCLRDCVRWGLDQDREESAGIGVPEACQSVPAAGRSESGVVRDRDRILPVAGAGKLSHRGARLAVPEPHRAVSRPRRSADGHRR